MGPDKRSIFITCDLGDGGNELFGDLHIVFCSLLKPNT